MGSPAATNEPNVTSRTTIAAARPIAVAAPRDGRWASWMARPPSSTSRSGVRAARATPITRLTAAVGSASGRWSKVTVANAVCWSAEIVPEPAAL
jgi:hypothetical protein